MANLEAIDKKMAELRKERLEAERRLGEIRHDMQGSDDPDIKAARGQADAAYRLVRDAQKSEPLEAARKAMDDARKAFRARLGKLLAAEPAAVPILDERAELAKQITELQKRIYEASR